jgi:serine/threonine protein kinase
MTDPQGLLTPDLSMAFTPKADSEPIPGYRLVEKLGVGGYGEVWKATAPGGLVKAVKILYGDMGGARATQELKALGRIKEVRHPFLLSLERIEIIDGQLFIVTELADGCLYDRFYECRKAGMKGIPREELLGNLRDTAEALDYMSEMHGLQHLDIKPQNLLLVGKRVKVADFGLVKDLLGSNSTAPGGVTPVYATPEAFDGRVSRYSDQYSLAIVYQEMLTGIRPFPGTTLLQLAAQHINSQPLLSPLPSGDRNAIAKALSKVPEQRFPSCLKMVEAIIAGGRSLNVGPVVSVPSRAPGDSKFILAKTPPVKTEPAASSAGLNLPTLSRTTPISESELPAAGSSPGLRPAPTPVPSGKPGLRPTLFLGIGGLAAATLRRLKKRLYDQYDGPGETPIFRFLLVDTDRECLRSARQGDPDEALDVAETLLTPLHVPEHYRSESKQLLRWLDRRWLYGIPRSLLTEGLRPLGRLAFVENAGSILDQLREILAQITSPQALSDTMNATGAEIRDQAPRVFVVASLAGGTGSGMVVSMAYAVRQVLGELGLSARGLCGLFPYATSPKVTEQEMARINACATLGEIDHFSRADTAYPGDPDHDLQPFRASHPPFEECYLVHLGEQLNEAEVESATDALADYLFLDASPAGGAFLDQLREQAHAVPRRPGAPFLFRSFGLSRIGAQGERPLDLAANLLCRRLTERWLAGVGEAEMKYLEREAQRLAVQQGLEEETLLSRMQTVVAVSVGQPQEAAISKILATAAEAAGSDNHQHMLDPLDRAFTLILTPAESSETVCPFFLMAVRKVAEERGTEISRTLVDWLMKLVEMPGKRFKAGASTASFLAKEVKTLAEKIKARLDQVTAARVALRHQIEAEKIGKGASLSWLGRALGGGRPAEDKLPGYCRLWLQAVAEENVLVILDVVKKSLKAFLADLALRQERVAEFAREFSSAIDNELAPNASTSPLPKIEGGADSPAGWTGTPRACPRSWCFASIGRFSAKCWNATAGCGEYSPPMSLGRASTRASPARHCWKTCRSARGRRSRARSRTSTRRGRFSRPAASPSRPCRSCWPTSRPPARACARRAPAST